MRHPAFSRRLVGFLFVVLWFCGQIACTNVAIHHRSNTRYAIHVYINWKRVCVVAQGETCRIKMKPGRYTFYAIVPGKPTHRWASAKRPAPFVVDEETVIVLGHKQLRNTTSPALTGKVKRPLPQQ